MNNIVLRLSFAAALLMLSSVACDLARGQNHSALFALPASYGEPVDAASPVALRFPATNASLIPATSLERRAQVVMAVGSISPD